MKNCVTVIIALLISFCCPAQQLTANGILTNLECKDSLCFAQFLQSKGFVIARPAEKLSKDIIRYTYTAVGKGCKGMPDTLNRETVTVITINNKINQVSIGFICKDNYANLLVDFKKTSFALTQEGEKAITLTSKIIPDWTVTVTTDQARGHSGIYTITLDRVSSVFIGGYGN